MNYSSFDLSLDAVLVLNNEKIPLYFNEAFLTLCEIPRRSIKEKTHCYDLITLSDPDLFCMPKGALGQSEPTQYREVAFEAISGKKGSLQICIQPDVEAAESRWIVFMRDMSLEESLHQKYREQIAKLDDYAKNLEKKVAERTAELNSANQLLTAILNSLGQGFLVFDSRGQCLSIYSKVSEIFLETTPAGKEIQDLIKIPVEKRNEFSKWYKMLFDEPIPFQDLIELGPREFLHSQGLKIKIEYHPMRNSAGKLDGLVMVLTDFTNEYRALESAKKDRMHVQQILKIVKNKNQFIHFLKESMASIIQIEKKPKQFEALSDVKRIIHTIKGGASLFFIDDLVVSMHELENRLATKKEISITECIEILSQIRKALSRTLKEKNDLFGLSLASLEPQKTFPETVLKEFYYQLKNDSDFEHLRESFLNVFLMESPINAFSMVDEYVQGLAQQLGKKIAPIEFKDSNLKLYLSPYQPLFSSLIHAFRNSIDHGIELPGERVAAGKKQEGCIEVYFKTIIEDHKSFLVINISDDGCGIDPVKVKENYLKKNPQITVDLKNPHDLLQLIFEEVSTVEQVTLVSGRGVGMSAIKAAAIDLGGTAQVESVLGIGTRLVVKVPLLQL